MMVEDGYQPIKSIVESIEHLFGALKIRTGP